MKLPDDSEGEPKEPLVDDDETVVDYIQGSSDADVVRLDPQGSSILEGVLDEEVSDEESGPSDDSIESFEAHSKDAFCIDCTDKWIVTGGEDDTAAVFRIESDEKHPVLRLKHADSVTCVRFNSTGLLLATGDMSGKIIITDLSNLNVRCEMDDCSDLEWLEWHFAADVLCAGGGDGVIWMYLIGSQGVAQTKTFVSSVGASCTVGRFLRDGKRLLAGYGNGTVLIWSLKENVATTVASASDSACTTVDEHPEFNWALVGTDNGRCLMINTKSNYLMSELTLEHGNQRELEDVDMSSESNQISVECARFCTSKDPWVAVASNQGLLSIYEIGGSVFPRHVFAHDGQVIVKCLWRENGNILISGCLDGNARVWDARNGHLLKCLCGAGEEIYDFAVHLNRIYTVSSGGHLRVFEL